MEFLVIFTCFFIRDVKVHSGDVYAGRVRRVREVLIDEVANLPEEGAVNHLIEYNLRKIIMTI